jgi:transcriptional regulator with XRE-family HTH domain
MIGTQGTDAATRDAGSGAETERNFDKRPYTSDEVRVAEYLKSIVPGVGTGDDPIGFLIASHNVIRQERTTTPPPDAEVAECVTALMQTRMARDGYTCSIYDRHGFLVREYLTDGVPDKVSAKTRDVALFFNASDWDRIVDNAKRAAALLTKYADDNRQLRDPKAPAVRIPFVGYSIGEDGVTMDNEPKISRKLMSVTTVDLGLRDLLRDPKKRQEFFKALVQDEIASEIRALRKKRGLNQTELADQAGMKQSAVSRIEQAEYSSWTLTTLMRVAAALDGRLRVQLTPAEDAVSEFENLEQAGVYSDQISAAASNSFATQDNLFVQNNFGCQNNLLTQNNLTIDFSKISSFSGNFTFFVPPVIQTLNYQSPPSAVSSDADGVPDKVSAKTRDVALFFNASDWDRIVDNAKRAAALLTRLSAAVREKDEALRNIVTKFDNYDGWGFDVDEIATIARAALSDGGK